MLSIDNKNKLNLLVASSRVYNFAYSNINRNAFFQLNNNLVNCFFYKQPFKNAVGHEYRAMGFLLFFFLQQQSQFEQKILQLDVYMIAKIMLQDIIYRKKNYLLLKGLFCYPYFKLSAFLFRNFANSFYCPLDASYMDCKFIYPRMVIFVDRYSFFLFTDNNKEPPFHILMTCLMIAASLLLQVYR